MSGSLPVTAAPAASAPAGTATPTISPPGYRPKFSLVLDRNTYYDNDKVEGTLKIHCEKETVLPPVYVALLCRLIMRGTSSNKPVSHTIYRYHKTPGPEHQEFFVVPMGDTDVRIAFNLPENMPASFSERDCYVVWDVRFLQRGKRVDQTLAVAGFRKANLYYSIPGHMPKAQVERRGLRGDQTLRVEGLLSKDVVSPGEPVQVRVVVHQPRESKLYLKRMKAHVYQTVKVTSKGKVLVREEYQLDTCKHDARTWTWSDVNGGLGGKIMEKSFMMMPRIDDEEHCATQTVQGAEGRKEKVLVPTVQLDETEKGLCVSVHYIVRLKGTVVGGRNFTLNIPFSLENARSEALESGVSEDAIEEALKVFPLIEEPPSYVDIPKLSVNSYTSLRRDSVDSVFGSISGDFNTGIGVQMPTLRSARRGSLQNILKPAGLLKPTNALASRSMQNLPLPTAHPTSRGPSNPASRRNSLGLPAFPLEFSFRSKLSMKEDSEEMSDPNEQPATISLQHTDEEEEGLPTFDEAVGLRIPPSAIGAH